MSHFTCLVVLPEVESNTPDERHARLEKALQPYHEYECTGVKDEYVVFVDCTDEVTKEYNEKGEEKVRLGNSEHLVDKYYEMFWRAASDEEVKKIEARDTKDMRCRTTGFGAKSVYEVYELPSDCEVVTVPYKELYENVELFATDWHGHIIENGRIGDYTNPNSKWDWWSIGGRWSGMLCVKPGATAIRGVPGAFGPDHLFSTDENTCDILQYKDIDLEAMKASHVKARRESYASIMKKAREMSTQEQMESYLKMYEMTPGMTEEEYIAAKPFEGLAGLTFAIVKDGKWYERGDMGWWGCVSNEKNQGDWSGEASEILADLKPTDWLIAIDCHI